MRLARSFCLVRPWCDTGGFVVSELAPSATDGPPKFDGTAAPKKLHLSFHGKVLEHLGVQMYQSPVNALAELVANAWDADAAGVDISLPSKLGMGAEIIVKDSGDGMTFQQCQDFYLTVGRNRRADPDAKTNAGRPVLGRKGIGKFAGFGIAAFIQVDTTSRETGERTVFTLDLGELTKGKYASTNDKDIKVDTYEPPDEARKSAHGTTIRLFGLTFKRLNALKAFRESMARRFLLLKHQAAFTVTVNGEAIPEDALDLAGIQYAFPRDLKADELPEGVTVDAEGWGVEELSMGRTLKWRFLFHKDTIEEEELRGITIYAGVKLAQAPFFFNLTQGVTAQAGLEYLSGQVKADFIDHAGEDLIATERQRVNWDHEATADVLEWGQKRVRFALRKWADRRGEQREKELDDKILDYAERLKKLQPHESRTVQKALRQLARIPRMSDEQYRETADAILVAWEGGRLKGLVDRMAEAPEMSADVLVSILLEVDVLSALNIAEGVKARLRWIQGLRTRIDKRELENPLRDYLADKPWLIGPKWETFRVEKKLQHLVEEAAKKSKWSEMAYAGRVDLTLSSGHQLLLLEFMKPGKPLDDDHLHRFDTYVRTLRKAVEADSMLEFEHVTGYLVADSLDKTPVLADRIKEMRKLDMYAMDWATLLNISLERWSDLFDAITSREPGDPRVRDLVEDFEITRKKLGIDEDA